MCQKVLYLFKQKGIISRASSLYSCWH